MILLGGIMKFKRILLLIGLLLSIFLIYVITIDKKIYYIALGDSLAAGQNPYGAIGYGYSDYISNYLENNNMLEFYTKKFSNSGYRITDLKRDIEDNKRVTIDDKEIAIKQALAKSDIITISIGANDLFYKLGITNNISFHIEKIEDVYSYIDEIVEDLDELLKMIRTYANEDIILIGYYNPIVSLSGKDAETVEKLFSYGNEKYKEIADVYNAYYIDIYDIFKNHPEYISNPLDIHPSLEGYEAIAHEIIELIEEKILD
jgi:lysophospholipase L1-like esterase